MATMIKAKYDHNSNSLIVKCPHCNEERKHNLDLFTAKQWLGSYLCDCGEELNIVEII